MIKWALCEKRSSRLYALTAVLLPPQTFFVKIYLDILLFLYTIYILGLESTILRASYPISGVSF